MIVRNKKVLVYGLGESGQGAIKLLLKQKAKVYVYDDNKKALDNLPNNLIKVENITENILSLVDLIVLNPSVSIYCENIKLAYLLNKKIISEIELAYLFKKGDVISITGSNGKSTTSTLIYNILKQAKIKTSLVGNIGNSFSKIVSENKKQTYVVEVSSFQLETTNKYNSKIATFLNFTENHLDRHFSLKEYFETKLKIFSNQRKKDFSVLNYDDEKVRDIKTNGKTYYFSKYNKVKGVYIFNNYIFFNDGKFEEKVMSVFDIKLKGEHNLENVLCAVLVAKLYKIKNEYISLAVSRFYGLSHRIEFVEKVNDIDYYNDSKSTTVKSTQTAINCFDRDRILLILGGSDKGFGFDDLFENLPKQVKSIICLGEVKDKILSSSKKYNFNNIQCVDSFNLAVKLSYIISKRENLNVVLLSPATASFDSFKNFEERGDTFKKLVKDLKSEVEV